MAKCSKCGAARADFAASGEPDVRLCRPCVDEKPISWFELYPNGNRTDIYVQRRPLSGGHAGPTRARPSLPKSSLKGLAKTLWSADEETGGSA